jgi:hypothetical protein
LAVDATCDLVVGCEVVLPFFKTGATLPQPDSPQHVVIPPDSWVYQWVHQNAENHPFDDAELRTVIQVWREMPDVVKSGIVAMTQDMA